MGQEGISGGQLIPSHALGLETPRNTTGWAPGCLLRFPQAVFPHDCSQGGTVPVTAGQS